MKDRCNRVRQSILTSSSTWCFFLSTDSSSFISSVNSSSSYTPSTGSYCQKKTKQVIQLSDQICTHSIETIKQVRLIMMTTSTQWQMQYRQRVQMQQRVCHLRNKIGLYDYKDKLCSLSGQIGLVQVNSIIKNRGSQCGSLLLCARLGLTNS